MLWADLADLAILKIPAVFLKQSKFKGFFSYFSVSAFTSFLKMKGKKAKNIYLSRREYEPLEQNWWKNIAASMYFWSVSWSWSISHFFWSTKEKFVQCQIFFVHSLEFIVQSFSKNEKLTGQLVGQETDQNHIFKKDWTKNSRE